MTREQVLRDLGNRFGDDILDIFVKSQKRVFIKIKPRAIAWVGPYIFRELGARFNIATGTDTPDGIEILYHFTLEDINLMLNIRVLLNRDNPVITSLGKHIEAVNWIEREMKELLGITFEGHPDPRRLLLPDNWPDGVYPLRQDYSEWDETAIRTRGV